MNDITFALLASTLRNTRDALDVAHWLQAWSWALAYSRRPLAVSHCSMRRTSTSSSVRLTAETRQRRQSSQHLRFNPLAINDTHRLCKHILRITGTECSVHVFAARPHPSPSRASPQGRSAASCHAVEAQDRRESPPAWVCPGGPHDLARVMSVSHLCGSPRAAGHRTSNPEAERLLRLLGLGQGQRQGKGHSVMELGQQQQKRNQGWRSMRLELRFWLTAWQPTLLCYRCPACCLP